MRILICGINYAPELTGVGKYTGEMAQWMAARGHDVRVVTAPPYYPAWQIGAGFSGRDYRRERISGVTVIRTPLWVPRQVTGATRLLHLASFAASSLPAVLWQSRWRPEIVMGIAPTILAAPGALLAARCCGARAWLHIQDFEMDAAFALGLLGRKSVPLRLKQLERVLLSGFDRVSTISEPMVERLHARGIAPSRTVLLPNWVDTQSIFPLSAPPALRAQLGLDGKWVALYSGSMGEKQGLEILIDAACRLKHHTQLHFLLCGEGSGAERLKRLAQGVENITFLPLQPADRLNELLNAADIHLLPQRADAADLVMPSKLGGMLSSGRPTVATAAAGTQIARYVSHTGLSVPPGDIEAFTGAILWLADHPEERRAMGERARALAVERLDGEATLRRLECTMAALANR